MRIIKEIKRTRDGFSMAGNGGEFHWYSAYTGELERNILTVIRVVARAWRNDTWCKTLRKKILFATCWKRDKKGF